MLSARDRDYERKIAILKWQMSHVAHDANRRRLGDMAALKSKETNGTSRILETKPVPAPTSSRGEGMGMGNRALIPSSLGRCLLSRRVSYVSAMVSYCLLV